jgi:hypothetical protein
MPDLLEIEPDDPADLKCRDLSFTIGPIYRVGADA